MQLTDDLYLAVLATPAAQTEAPVVEHVAGQLGAKDRLAGRVRQDVHAEAVVETGVTDTSPWRGGRGGARGVGGGRRKGQRSRNTSQSCYAVQVISDGRTTSLRNNFIVWPYCYGQQEVSG